jgi:pyruvate/2-oxoglutarate dehydrogenase complex dihydrolipoamide dehydrogenase (E3) component
VLSRNLAKKLSFYEYTDTMYDIIIIGAGSGGLNIAVFMVKSGFRVLLVDKDEKNIGGDCLNRGCIPSKSLIHIAREVEIARNVEKYGITGMGYVDFPAVMKSINEKIETIRMHENSQYFKNMGIEVVLGEAKLSGKQEVIVNGKVYKGKKIVVATGSKPRQLMVEGIEKAHVVTNESVFNLTSLPKHLLVVGVGPVGIELGQAFLMLGSSVTFVGNESRILPREKEEYAAVLYAKMIEQGAKFIFTHDIVRIDNGTTLVIKNTEEESRIFFDTILVAIGRQLSIENLGLENAGIEVEKGKIIVNDYLQTTNKNVYLCGDIAGGYQFTHAAELHAKVLLNNFFNPFFKKKLSYDTFSWVTYTKPELATFGRSEDILQKSGVNYEKISTLFTDDDRSITSDSTYGKSEVYVDSSKKIIVGGTMVADNAGELVQEIILAMEAKMPIKKIFNKIYPYPTASRINKKLISEYFKKRFNEQQKKILRLLYKL